MSRGLGDVYKRQSLCRSVEIAPASESDFEGDSDAAYGARVFLRHYCVHFAGPDVRLVTSSFPGDRRAARGFNGDIGQHLETWNDAFDGTEPANLGQRVARKALLATAGLVSVHDSTWTTDRRRAALRWGELHPDLRRGLDQLLDWATGSADANRQQLRRSLDETVAPIARQFADDIGLWTPTTTE